MNTLLAAALARALGGRKVLVRSDVGCQPEAADDTVAAETTAEAYLAVGIGYLAEIGGAGPAVKLDSTDGSTPIPITNPADPGSAGAHPLTDSATARGCPACRRGHSTGHSKQGDRAGRSSDQPEAFHSTTTRELLLRPAIVGVRDTLFDGTPSQTYRLAQEMSHNQPNSTQADDHD